MHGDRLLHRLKSVAKRELDLHVAKHVRLRREQEFHAGAATAKAGDYNAALVEQIAIQRSRLEHEAVLRGFHIVDFKRDLVVLRVFVHRIFVRNADEPRCVRLRRNGHGNSRIGLQSRCVLNRIGKCIGSVEVRFRLVFD